MQSAVALYRRFDFLLVTEVTNAVSRTGVYGTEVIDNLTLMVGGIAHLSNLTVSTCSPIAAESEE